MSRLRLIIKGFTLRMETAEHASVLNGVDIKLGDYTIDLSQYISSAAQVFYITGLGVLGPLREAIEYSRRALALWHWLIFLATLTT